MKLIHAHRCAKGEARRAQCINNVREISLAVVSYATDTRAFPPYYDRADEEGWYWAYKIKPYTKAGWMDKGFHCPDFKMTNLPAIPWNFSDRRPIGRGCYDLNVQGTGMSFDELRGGVWKGLGVGGLVVRGPNLETSIPTLESDIRVPASMVALGDVSIDPVSWQNALGYLDVMFYLRNYVDGGLLHGNAEFALRRLNRRHNRMFNLAFADGHIESRKPERFFNYNGETLRMWNNDNQPRGHTN